MMQLLALIGATNLVLSSAVVLVLPIVLAARVAVAWLWLYAAYVGVILLFLALILTHKPIGKDSKDGNGDGGKEERA